MALTSDDCRAVADELDAAIQNLPGEARQLRATMTKTSREYRRAAKLHDRARDELNLYPTIVAAGGIAPGEHLLPGSTPYEVRRVTETGIEIFVDGKWSWENVSSRSTPVVTVEVV